MAVSKQLLSYTTGLKQIIDPDSNSVPENDINSGVATLYGIRVKNTLNSANVFTKLYNNAAPTVGTTAPDIVIRTKNGVIRHILFPKGIAFGTALSFATVTTGGTGGATNPAAAVEVDLLVA